MRGRALLALPFLLAPLSCGDGGGSGTTPPITRTTPLPPITLGVIDLSGAVYGSASIDGSPCPTMGTLLLVLAGATADGESYALQVHAPKPGRYVFRRGSTRSVALVQLLDESRSNRRWAAGLKAAPGSGLLTVETHRVEVDAVLDRVAAARGRVRIRGEWPCS